MDAAPAWTSPGIYCSDDTAGNPVYCATTTSQCCARWASGGGDGPNNRTFECVNNSIGSCVGGQPIKCDDQSDCPSGQVCCGSFDQNQGYRAVQCATSCTNSLIPGTTAVRFCDPDAPVDECASIGKTCTASGSLHGYYVCK